MKNGFITRNHNKRKCGSIQNSLQLLKLNGSNSCFGEIQRGFFITNCWNLDKLLKRNTIVNKWLYWIRLWNKEAFSERKRQVNFLHNSSYHQVDSYGKRRDSLYYYFWYIIYFSSFSTSLLICSQQCTEEFIVSKTESIFYVWIQNIAEIRCNIFGIMELRLMTTYV